jgi:hypothetical protein
MQKTQDEIIDKYTRKLAAKIYYQLEAMLSDEEQRLAAKKVFAVCLYDTMNEMKGELLRNEEV